MGVSNGSAGQPAEHARTVRDDTVHDGEPASSASRWARDGAARPRKVVPLRIPSAPQLVAASPDAAATATAQATAPASASSAASRMGPDLLAQDAALQRLLESPPPDP